MANIVYNSTDKVTPEAQELFQQQPILAFTKKLDPTINMVELTSLIIITFSYVAHNMVEMGSDDFMTIIRRLYNILVE